MKRKDYQKPTMEIVQLQHQTHLLAGSDMNVRSTMDTEWEEEDI